MTNSLFPVLFEDELLLVIHKPSGILVHKSKATQVREDTVVDLLEREYAQRFHPVHRLDRATSGVLLFAKDKEAARSLGLAFEAREVDKSYLALVRGLVSPQIIDYPLKHLEKPELLQEAKTQILESTPLILPYAVGKYPEARYSLLLLKPETGRRHQLRRHLKHLHHPIVGDTVYGNGEHNRLFRDKFDCQRLLLHHFQLSFPHPLRSQVVTVKAPLDGVFLHLSQLIMASTSGAFVP